MTKAKLLLMVLLGTFITSCTDDAYYNAYVPVSDAGWPEDSVITFDVVVDDTTSEFGVIVMLRHNTNYPYQNFWLNRSISFAGEEIHSDRISYQLAKPTGEWLGKGFGDIKAVEAPYNRQVLRFQNKGTYQFKFQQGMREERLPGLEDIGLRIVPIENE